MAFFLGRFKPELQLTLDGGVENIHDMSRGNGTFKKQDAAIKLLKANGYNDSIVIRTNLWENNCSLENINSILQYCQSYGIKQLNVALAHKTDRFSQVVDDYESCMNISQWIKKLEESYKDIEIEFKEGKIELGCPFVSEDVTINCGIRVTPDGDVYPCQLFDDPLFRIGNIKSQSIESILNGKLLSDFLDMMRIRTSFIRECVECAFQGACNGGCPAKIFMQHGNILSVDQKCIDRKKILQSGLIEMSKIKT